MPASAFNEVLSCQSAPALGRENTTYVDRNYEEYCWLLFSKEKRPPAVSHFSVNPPRTRSEGEAVECFWHWIVVSQIGELVASFTVFLAVRKKRYLRQEMSLLE